MNNPAIQAPARVEKDVIIPTIMDESIRNLREE